MLDAFNTLGLRYVGVVTNKSVNGGNSVPLFEPAAPEGCCNINTLTGWNKRAAEANHRSFISANGREPENDAELKEWVNRMCRGQ